MTADCLSSRIRIEADVIYFSERQHFGQVDLAVFQDIANEVEALEAEVNHLKAKLSERPEKMEVDYSEVKINIDERIRALEEQNKSLKEQIVGLEELNHGLDYCAEESDRKRGDAEVEVKRLTERVKLLDAGIDSVKMAKDIITLKSRLNEVGGNIRTLREELDDSYSCLPRLASGNIDLITLLNLIGKHLDSLRDLEKALRGEK